MPVIDLTSDYLGQSLNKLSGIVDNMLDPRNRIAMEQARRERELFPLKQAALQQDIGLGAARALTEGAQQELLRSRTADQALRTNFRGQLGGFGAEPQMPIADAVSQFNEAVRNTPGAAAAIVPQMPQSGMNPVPLGQEQPNPLLPPLSAPTAAVDPMRLAVLAAAISENPNPAALTQGVARAEALQGGVTEQRGRELALGQGIVPNVNTAITPQWQGAIVDNKNAAAMQRVEAQQLGANQRAVISPMAKAIYGDGAGGRDVKYTDQRHMSQDAGGIADRIFRIERDDQGNPTNVTQPAVLLQRDQLARRMVGHMQNGLDIGTARDRAAVELFGSANFGDPNHYMQPTEGGWFSQAQPFAARNINPEGVAPVEPVTGQGNQQAAFAEVLNRLFGGSSIKPQSGLDQAAPQPAAPQAQPAPQSAAEAIMGPPAPPPDTTFTPRPSKAETEQRKRNDDKIASLNQSLAQIEAEIRSGKTTVPTAPSGFDGQQFNEFGHAVIDLSQDPDTYNALLERRLKIKDEITKLQGKKSDNGGSQDDILIRKYLP